MGTSASEMPFALKSSCFTCKDSSSLIQVDVEIATLGSKEPNMPEVMVHEHTEYGGMLTQNKTLVDILEFSSIFRHCGSNAIGLTIDYQHSTTQLGPLVTGIQTATFASKLPRSAGMNYCSVIQLLQK